MDNEISEIYTDFKKLKKVAKKIETVQEFEKTEALNIFLKKYKGKITKIQVLDLIKLNKGSLII